MISSRGVKDWRRQAHGVRLQSMAISYIANKLNLYEALGIDSPSMNSILIACNHDCTPTVSVETLRRWWKVYEEWGEIPHLAKKRNKALKKRFSLMGENATIDNEELMMLKDIVDRNPNFYLDEICVEFVKYPVSISIFLQYGVILQPKTDTH